MAEITITKENFNEEVLNCDKTVLVDFWATWCGPCRMIAPVIEEIANELEGQVKVGKVNVDEQPEIAVKYGIMSIPTIMVFKDGEAVQTAVGFRTKEQLLELLI